MNKRISPTQALRIVRDAGLAADHFVGQFGEVLRVYGIRDTNDLAIEHDGKIEARELRNTIRRVT